MIRTLIANLDIRVSQHDPLSLDEPHQLAATLRVIANAQEAHDAAGQVVPLRCARGAPRLTVVSGGGDDAA